MKRIAIAIVASLALLAACSEQAPTAADKAAEAAKAAGEAAKIATEDAKEAANQAADAVKQAADSAAQTAADYNRRRCVSWTAITEGSPRGPGACTTPCCWR